LFKPISWSLASSETITAFMWVHTGDVVSSPPDGWHWHGALPGTPATHVTFKQGRDPLLQRKRKAGSAAE